MYRYLLVLLIAAPFSAQSANLKKVYSSTDRRRAKIVNKKSVEFVYEKPSWNLNPSSVEKGTLFLRDRASNNFYEIELFETEPNSSIFSLRYDKNELPKEEIVLEIYATPKKLLGDSPEVKIRALIKSQSIFRKPFLLRSMDNKGQIIDIFDKKEDAHIAFTKYKELKGIKYAKEKSLFSNVVEVNRIEQPENKRLIKPSTLKSLSLADEANLKNQMTLNKELRETFSTIEKKRRESIKTKGEKFTERKIVFNENLGSKLLKQSSKSISEGNFEKSKDLLLRASNKVPHSENLYQQYGLSLFRSKEYNKSLVVLDLVSTPAKKQIIKLFYKGLNYFHLKEYDSALLELEKAMDLKSKEFSATAAYYHGVSLTQLERYDEAKNSFQYVLDNSSSPDLDSRAERYIEYGIRQKQLKESKDNRWFFTGLLGATYDSNVILLLDSIRDQPLQNIDIEGLRLMGSADIRWRPYFKEKNELSLKASATMIHTRGLDFGLDETLTRADPWIFGLSAPYTHRGLVSGKGYTFDLEPGFETLVMDLNGEGRGVILNSILLDFNNTLVANKGLILQGDLQIRNDASTQDDGLEEASAMKYSINLNSIIVLNKGSDRYLIPGLGYSINNARGENFTYNRLDLNLTFTTALFSKLSWTTRLGYFLANYRNSLPQVRVDNNYSISSGFAYPLNPNWSLGLNANYQVNDSTTNKFNKFQAFFTASFSY